MDENLFDFWPSSDSSIKWTKLKWAELHIYPGKLEIIIICSKYWNNVLVHFWNFPKYCRSYFVSSEIRFVPYFLFRVWNLQYFFSSCEENIHYTSEGARTSSCITEGDNYCLPWFWVALAFLEYSVVLCAAWIGSAT